MGCPYSSEVLDYWDGVCNPMGEACYSCEEEDCEHNFWCENEFVQEEVREQ